MGLHRISVSIPHNLILSTNIAQFFVSLKVRSFLCLCMLPSDRLADSIKVAGGENAVKVVIQSMCEVI